MPGDGLVVAASGTTLDLNGHCIFGASEQSTTVAGARLENVQKMTVAGPGEIYHFAVGVAIMRASNDTIKALNVHDNNSTQFVNDNPSLALFGDGIDVVGSSYDVVAHSYVHQNGPFSGISLFTFTDGTTGAITGPPPEHNVIKDNEIVDNNVPDVCPNTGTYYLGTCVTGEPVFNEDIGVRIEGPQADFNTVAKNDVTGSGRDGISVLNTFSLASAPGANIPPNTDTLITGNDSSANVTRSSAAPPAPPSSTTCSTTTPRTASPSTPRRATRSRTTPPRATASATRRSTTPSLRIRTGSTSVRDARRPPGCAASSSP
ncbi:MAG TPA: right-handed parallel beta-helix repeat-containing protein [Acidimicrobiales bacterium]|nr:right-handed parallel beta-helix repeat-containing protein [Acidimicrobiales bacterium]